MKRRTGGEIGAGRGRGAGEGSLDRRTFLALGIEAAVAVPLLGALGCDGGADGTSAGEPGADAAGADGDTTTGADTHGATDSTTDAPGSPPDDGAVETAFDPDAVPEDPALFPVGVSAGAVGAGTALVCGIGEGTLRMWRDGASPGHVALAVDRAVSGKDGYVKEAVDGLLPGTVYRYALFTGAPFSARSAIGQVRMAPAPGDLSPVTLGAASCTKWVQQPFTAIGLVADQGIDAMCHLGDVSYNDEATTLEEYRALWRQTLSEPNYRKLLTAAGLYVTWDDHEIANNDQRFDLPPDRLQAARDSFFEALPVPRRDGDRFWASYRWGHTVEIFVMDCRSERKPETIGGEDIYISKEQMAWVKQALSDSPCHFKVMMSSVPVSKLNIYWALEHDRWQGYVKQREELLDHIVDNDITNVWWLGGDFHIGAVMRVETEGPRRRMWEILGGPGGSNQNPLVLLTDNNPATWVEVYPPEQFAYASFNNHSATTLTFDPATDSVRVRFTDGPTGEVLYDATLSQDS